MRPDYILFDDRAALIEAAAERIAAAAQEATTARGQFSLVLSGGSTPLPLYDRLIQPDYRDSIPWLQTLFFWGDERCVPPDQAESNFGQARSRLLEPLGIAAEQIFRICGEMQADKGARDYARQLELHAGHGHSWPRFDVVLLGMGDDGHTSSLFPGPISATERKSPVMAVEANYAGRPSQRVTLTPRVFNDARQVLFLVRGAGKAKAVAAALDPTSDPETWPARRIQPSHGHLTWLLDRAAAAHLLT